MRAYEFITEALSPAAIEATSGRFGQQLMAKLAKDPQGASVKDDPSKFIEWVANEIDPTGNSKYTKWIVARFVDPNGGIRFVEDLSKLTEPMTRYARLTQSGAIPANNRDINQFKDMTSFLNLMDQYAEKKTGNEMKSEEEQALIKSGQAVLYKDTGKFKIVIPKTEEAAKYYGEGTKWCTAGDNNNRFDYYNKFGPLYDIIFRGSGVKWQFHFETAQFMDEQDEPLDPDLVKPISGLFSEDMWLAAVKYWDGKRAIQYVENPSEAVQLAAVKEYPNAIRRIKNPTEAVQIAAVRANGDLIQIIDNPSEAVQIAAILQDGDAIRYIENPSEAVQLAAVNNAGYTISYIENPSEAVQLAAVKTNNGHAIEYIKNPSEAVQLAAVNRNGYMIQHIDNPSDAVQMAAVKSKGNAIHYIKNPSEAVQLAAVRKDGYAIRYIENPSEAMKMIAVKSDKDAFRYIENPSEAVKLAAVKANGDLIDKIKNPSEAVQLAAVSQNGYAIQGIKNPSEAVQLAAVSQNGAVIRRIKNPSAAVQALANLKRS